MYFETKLNVLVVTLWLFLAKKIPQCTYAHKLFWHALYVFVREITRRAVVDVIN